MPRGRRYGSSSSPTLTGPRIPLELRTSSSRKVSISYVGSTPMPHVRSAAATRALTAEAIITTTRSHRVRGREAAEDRSGWTQRTTSTQVQAATTTSTIATTISPGVPPSTWRVSPVRTARDTVSRSRVCRDAEAIQSTPTP